MFNLKIGATAAYTYAFRGTAINLNDYLISIKTLPELGIYNFDLEILQPQHVAIYESKDNIKRLKETLANNKVNVVGFTAWACVGLIHSIKEENQQHGYQLFAKIARIARDFNAEYIHLGSDMISEYIVQRDSTYVAAPVTKVAIPDSLSYQNILDDYAKRLAKLAQIAQDNGLKFSIEPRANSLICGADSFMDIYRRAGHSNLYCCLDVVHCAFHRENLLIAIEKVSQRLLVFQLCNAIPGQMIHYPLAEGSIEIKPILRALRKINFQGYLMLEIYRSGKDNKDIVDSWYKEGMAMIKKEELK